MLDTLPPLLLILGITVKLGATISDDDDGL